LALAMAAILTACGGGGDAPPVIGPVVAPAPEPTPAPAPATVNLAIEVVDTAGRPVAGIDVTPNMWMDVITTGPDGRASFLTSTQGEVLVQAAAPAYYHAQRQIDLAALVSHVVQITVLRRDQVTLGASVVQAKPNDDGSTLTIDVDVSVVDAEALVGNLTLANFQVGSYDCTIGIHCLYAGGSPIDLLNCCWAAPGPNPLTVDRLDSPSLYRVRFVIAGDKSSFVPGRTALTALVVQLQPGSFALVDVTVLIP
jgi:hypothetical protein